MKHPILIAINGKARSGKDTAADFIQRWCEDHGFTSARESFARRLKESAAHALGVFENEVEFCNQLKGDYERGFIEVRMGTKESGPNVVVARVTGREFLQFYGTEAHRDIFGANFWVDAVLPLSFTGEIDMDWWKNFRWEDKDGQTGGLADICLITDCRFPNEAERIRALGGQVWKLVREGSGAGNHASEQELPGEMLDLVIDNNGTLESLQGSIDLAMEELIGLPFSEAAL